ncbi:MAG: PIN domain-containing protein [Deltaproteobacteria bacterium]|nr:PIN domain-containing protein [Deltaproteobacteria bacterium]
MNIDVGSLIEDCEELIRGNRSHSLAADRLLQGFNRGQIAPKCVFPTDYALKPEKGCWLSGGKVNNYGCRNKRELTETVKFLKQYEVVHFSRSISEKTVKLIRKYNLSHGLLMADAIIAATVLVSEAQLFSKNASDFVFIKNLNVNRPY